MTTIDTATFPHIPRTKVESSNLFAFGYDPTLRTLSVQFKGSGDIWHYHDVPEELVTEFREAESVGRFFGQRIRGKFTGDRMTGPCPKCGDVGVVAQVCEDCGCAAYRRVDKMHTPPPDAQARA